MATVKVRQLIAVGTRLTGTDPKTNEDQYTVNQVGDVYELEDRVLDSRYRQPDGPATLVDSYVAAGYVELVE